MPQLSPRDRQHVVEAAKPDGRSAVLRRVIEAKQRLAVRRGAIGTDAPAAMAEPAPRPATMADHRAAGFLSKFSLEGRGLEIGPSHNRKAPSPGQVADFYLNLAKRDERTSWHVGEAGEWRREGNRADAIRFTDQAIDGRVHDVHVWRFTPSSFRLQLAQLAILGLAPAEESFFETSLIGEFYVGLTPSASHEHRSDAELLQLALEARHELGQHIAPLPGAPTGQ